MIYIDGSSKLGSGTILRYSVALSSLLGEAVHISNIRVRRKKPGLRPQHLASVAACAQMCGAKVEGATVDSTEIIFKPGSQIKGGSYEWKIGTAGSTTLMVMTLLPIALYANGNSVFRISGGLFQDFAPSAHHMQNVLFPTLARMGIKARLEIIRPGYMPKGGGIIQVRMEPLNKNIKSLQLHRQGKVTELGGISISSHLKQQRVSKRMADECQKILADEGYHALIEHLWDKTALQAGASLAVWAKTDTQCILGSDEAGKRGRSSEEIGRYVATNLLADLKTGATVDRFLADQLIIYAALAEGVTEYILPFVTEHVETNLWLVEKFGASTHLGDKVLHIKGLGYVHS